MRLIAGVDEVGRGPLAGPVVACALILPEDHSIDGLKDSKKLSKKKREELYHIICSQAITIGIGESDVENIDKLNIREATFRAMKNALKRLDPKPDKAYVDGEYIKNCFIPNEGIVGGDRKIDSIMASSIVAKVTRDHLMSRYSKIFYEYGFETNSGYGTKFHIKALEKYKATPIHRKSFNPVANQMPSLNWIIENDRIQWLGLKLAGLFLMRKGFSDVEVISDHPLSNKIDSIRQKKGINFCINVFTAHRTINDKNINAELNKSLEKFSDLSKSVDFDHKRYIFRQLFVKIKNGRSLITFNKNIL